MTKKNLSSPFVVQFPSLKEADEYIYDICSADEGLRELDAEMITFSRGALEGKPVDEEDPNSFLVDLRIHESIAERIVRAELKITEGKRVFTIHFLECGMLSIEVGSFEDHKH